jgi:hypothetical protein
MLTTYKETNQPAKLLSAGNTNAKTAKNWLTSYILYLSPASQNSAGRNLCPKASEGCRAACLFSAGRGRFNNVQQARINRTEYLLRDRAGFLSQLADEINKAAKKEHKKTGQEIAVRLNGTSDLKLVEMLTARHEIAPNVVFYDYTKIQQKAGNRTTSQGHRYCVTFSRAEDNEAQALEVLKKRGNVAAVFAGELPKTWHGFRVIDGDASDIEMLNASGVVLGLKAKGDAKKDLTGFVIN